MNNLNQYLKYYFLEKYLLGEVHENFHSHGRLTLEEFFAIVIWKSNRSKTKIMTSLRRKRTNIPDITAKMHDTEDPAEKVKILDDIEFVGIPIASAILTICYPDEFTVVHYRAVSTLKAIHKDVPSHPTTKIREYLAYVEICKKLAKQENLQLRDFDRALWAKNFYDGKNGLRSLVIDVR